MSLKKGNKTLAAPSLADTKQISIEVLDGVDPYKQGYSYQDIINFRRNQIYSQASQNSQEGASLIDDTVKNEQESIPKHHLLIRMYLRNIY